MPHSIRLFLIDRLQCIVDHAFQHVAKKLRGSEVHPQARYDLSDHLIVGVDNARAEGQADDTVSLPGFGYQIDEQGLNAIVADFCPVSSDWQHPTGLYDDLIAHQPCPPIENYDFGTLNANAVGVQP